MSVQEMLQVARTLSVDERKQLVKALVDMLAESSQARPKRKRTLREFRGLGAHLYDGTDAQTYVSQIRSQWDDRP
jgi:hypothetical protein